jgi:hypothetical protein
VELPERHAGVGLAPVAGAVEHPHVPAHVAGHRVVGAEEPVELAAALHRERRARVAVPLGGAVEVAPDAELAILPEPADGEARARHAGAAVAAEHREALGGRGGEPRVRGRRSAPAACALHGCFLCSWAGAPQAMSSAATRWAGRRTRGDDNTTPGWDPSR